MSTAILDPVRVPLSGTLLVEAGAGTGKTWTIGALMLRFLLEEGLELPSLLVLTFTDAATAELRDRLRRRLEEARREVEGEEAAQDPFLAQLRQVLQAEGRWNEVQVRSRIRAALASFDEASILTIHGFCHRVLAERAVAFGLPAELELGEDDDSSLRREGLDQLRRAWQSLPPGLLDWLRVQGGLLDPEPWLELARLGSRHPRAERPAGVELEALLAALPALEAAHAQSAREVGEIIQRAGVAELAGLIAASGLNKSSYKAASVPKWLALTQDWLETGASPGACREARRFTPTAFAAKTTQKGVPPSHAAFHGLGVLLEREDALVSIYKKVLEGLQVQALELWPARAAQARLESRKLDFNDLLRLVAEGLEGAGGGELTQALRRRWTAALVDEFQDTDPLQAGIFRRIFQEGGLPLVLVGDPKQAIYGFRGADLHAYLAAARGADRQAGLRVNWRSGAGLLASVNRLFAQERFPAARGAFLRPDIQAAELQPCGQVEERTLWLDGRPLAPLQVFQELRDGLKRGEARRQVARSLAGLLARLLRPSDPARTGWRGAAGITPVQGREVAILVRTHSQGALMVECLAEAGLASVQLSPESVFASREAVDLQRLLLALARPHDTGRLRALLAGPLALALGSTPGAALASAELQEELQGRLHSALQQAGREGTVPALRGLVMELGLAEALLGMRRGERRLTNWLHLLELLPALEGPGGLDPAELALRLAWARRSGGPDAELRLESEDNLLRVLTLHKSKGLEFPLVCCPFLWDEGRRGTASGAVLLHDAQGSARLRPWSPANPLEAEERAALQEEELAESLRLAYVGLTRARHHTLLHCVAPAARSRSRPGALDWLLCPEALPEDCAPGAAEAWKACWEEGASRQLGAWEGLAVPGELGVEPLEAGAEPRVEPPADSEPPLLVFPPVERIPDRPRLSSFSSLLLRGPAPERLDEWADAGEDQDGDRPDEAEDWRARFPRGAAPGTCLHRLLELVDFRPSRDPARLESLCRRELLAHGLDEGLAPGTARWLAEILDAPLAAGGFQLARLEARQRVAELEFHLSVQALPTEEFRALLERHGLFSPRRLGLETEVPLQPPALPGDLPEGFLKGYIDLIHEEEGRWWVLDWKSNRLGASAAVYSRRAMAEEMARSGYFIQALLYLTALHRHLGRTLAAYEPERHLGGLRYLFLRGLDATRPGQGVFEDRPPLSLILELDQRLGGAACR